MGFSLALASQSFTSCFAPTKDSPNTAYLQIEATTNSAKKRPCPFQSLALRKVSAFVSIYVVLNLLHICVWNSTLRLVKGGLHCKSAFRGSKGGWFRGVGRHTSLELEWVPLSPNISGQMEEGGMFWGGMDLIWGKMWHMLDVFDHHKLHHNRHRFYVTRDNIWRGTKTWRGAAWDWDETKAVGFLTPRTDSLKHNLGVT